ncbi:MAG: YdcH family protein [Candidatus Paracaedibacteraceae bacterium]|nr:YdcH family protein [Candidatus Paracaedibacteraceae bacterium]
MTIQSHLDALLKKHEDLDKEIRRIETRAFVSETNLHEMKKKRLRVKEEIERTRNYSGRQS